MRRNLVCVLGALAIAVVALAPTKAAAGWGWWGGPRFGFGITIGPRYGYWGGYPYAPYGYYGYRPATMAAARTATSLPFVPVQLRSAIQVQEPLRVSEMALA